MEKHNAKRKLRKSRKVLDHIRKRTLKRISSDNIVRENNVNAMNKKVIHSTNIPNVTSNRLTLDMQSYGNVVISETIKRNLMSDNIMSNMSQISHDRIASQCNPTPNEAQNMCVKSGSVTHDVISSANDVYDPITLYHDFIQQMPEVLYKKAPSLMKCKSYLLLSTKIKEMFKGFINFPSDQQSKSDVSVSDQNDSLFNPLEYIRRGTATANTTTASFNIIGTASQANHINLTNRVSSDSDIDETSSVKSMLMTTPSITHFTVLSDTPECEYFPHKLNR